MKNKLNFLIYSTPLEEVSIQAVIEGETVWLTQRAMAELFNVEVPAISKYLSNIYSEGELDVESTLSKMEIVQKEGSRNKMETIISDFEKQTKRIERKGGVNELFR
ncbi:MAG: hypothetical protein ACRC6R_05475 [Bacteroidales bacterium]